MTATYDGAKSVDYTDDLRSGFVVATKGTTRPRSFWYGPEHAWSTTFGPLEGRACSVAVFDSKVKARNALRHYQGGSRLDILTLEQARADTADRLETYAHTLLARVARLRGEVDTQEET